MKKICPDEFVIFSMEMFIIRHHYTHIKIKIKPKKLSWKLNASQNPVRKSSLFFKFEKKSFWKALQTIHFPLLWIIANTSQIYSIVIVFPLINIKNTKKRLHLLNPGVIQKFFWSLYLYFFLTPIGFLPINCLCSYADWFLFIIAFSILWHCYIQIKVYKIQP